MNKYTDKSHFTESAEHILENSELLIQADCIILDDVLYERLAKGKYRFFFSTDDYDYLEDEEMISVLDKIFESWT
jgi:hypothetical protein